MAGLVTAGTGVPETGARISPETVCGLEVEESFWSDGSWLQHAAAYTHGGFLPWNLRKTCRYFQSLRRVPVTPTEVAKCLSEKGIP